MLSPRRLCFGIAILCAAMIAVAILYFELALGIPPCPLCVVQRINVVAVGVIALAAALHNPGSAGRRIYAGFGLLVTAAALGVGARHMWLQSAPEAEQVACTPGLDLLFQLYSPLEALLVMLSGSGECAELQWSLLGLSIPAWTVVGFALIFIALSYLLIARR